MKSSSSHSPCVPKPSEIFSGFFFAFVSSLATASLLEQSASRNTYDYIIVGGGTTGLVIANRLSEKLDTVLVVEAGDSVYSNSNVTDTGAYGKALGTAIDWQYTTIPQEYGNNEVQTLHAAKAVGGTSTINGMSYTRAEAVQINSWEKAGNPGWTWDNLFPYYMRSEKYEIPDAKRINGGASYNPEYHGFTGPLKVGYPSQQAINGFASALNESYQAMGVPYSTDVNGGKMRGFNVYPKTVDAATDIREDAARAYYWPFSRPNLYLKANSTANRLLWAAHPNLQGNFVATAIEVTAVDGKHYAAGSLRTPPLLELSGIGNPSILQNYGITTKVPLPGVGENLIDQTNNGLTFSMIPGEKYTGESGYAAYPNVTDIFGSAASSLASSIFSDLPSYASRVAAQNNNASTASALLSLFKLQHSLIFDSQVPIAEIVHYPYDGSFGSQFWSTLPFARGNIHIASADLSVPANINPNYFMLEYDIQSQIGIARFMRKLFSMESLAKIAGSESWPGTRAVPANTDDATWTKWLKQNYSANYHVLSTAIMLPRAMGGVVSHRLKVYGTANVRVVDASIFPFQLCGHLMSTLYAVAERASDLINEDSEI
ncbi:GMC oxidoreductase [Aplosporella prunicola CBS 121167]|uniref:GMC oxidoreductase n=1 Tax=Aplosporella prunicola CBS 121167 TaxID=1176127 RepID=A0A6A6BLA5_9PEZI|nr:GMC oxidoreductase [Aplosporella prunicola CBS 121167]KAF2143637.1 GMC oxidoreductase [Aplosporella prunicola CBS 121167]